MEILNKPVTKVRTTPLVRPLLLKSFLKYFHANKPVTKLKPHLLLDYYF